MSSKARLVLCLLGTAAMLGCGSETGEQIDDLAAIQQNVTTSTVQVRCGYYMGTYVWSANAYAYVASDGTRKWYYATGAKWTATSGFTFGVEERNPSAEAVIQDDGQRITVSGAATIAYGIPTPWGVISWITQNVKCSETFSTP